MDTPNEIEKDSTPRERLSPEQIIALNKPLPPEAVSQHPTKAYLSTIKAIYVVERFNQVFGLGEWYINNEFVERVEVPTKTGSALNVIIKATFHAPKYGITIPDIFGGNDNPDLGDAYKGACTDALTKIGSYLGVGMDVYKGLADKKPSQKQNSAPSTTPTPKANKVPPTMSNGANTGSGELPATAKQKDFIKTLLKANHIEKLSEAGFQEQELTIGYAKEIIDKLLKMKEKIPSIQVDENY